jgi:hypothetical protein
MQKQLVDERASPPPIGRVGGELKEEIMLRGQLNDVAACLWIIGRSSEYLADYETARYAYQQAQELTYARVWDPEGELFWSPAVKAGDDLVTLNETHPPQLRWSLAPLFSSLMGIGAVLALATATRLCWERNN